VDLAKVVVLPLSALWALSECGVLLATYSRREARRHDRNSLFIGVGGTLLAIAAALICWWKGIGRFAFEHPALPVAGIVLVVAGIGLRWSAILTLRRFFTIHVAIQEGHELITAGVYRFMRHPGYSGSLLSLLGIGIALQNWPCLLVLVGIPLAVLLFRIRVEEAALTAAFGATYRDYCRRTARLIPGVF